MLTSCVIQEVYSTRTVEAPIGSPLGKMLAVDVPP
jgi:hypothetical protein